MDHVLRRNGYIFCKTISRIDNRSVSVFPSLSSCRTSNLIDWYISSLNPISFISLSLIRNSIFNRSNCHFSITSSIAILIRIVVISSISLSGISHCSTVSSHVSRTYWAVCRLHVSTPYTVFHTPLRVSKASSI